MVRYHLLYNIHGFPGAQEAHYNYYYITPATGSNSGSGVVARGSEYELSGRAIRQIPIQSVQIALCVSKTKC